MSMLYGSLGRDASLVGETTVVATSNTVYFENIRVERTKFDM